VPRMRSWLGAGHGREDITGGEAAAGSGEIVPVVGGDVGLVENAV
jgi:hypothetical protein